MADNRIGLQAVLEDASFQAGIKSYNAGIDSMESANEGAIQSSAQLSSGLSATDQTMAASGGSAVDLAAKLDIAKQAFSAVQKVVSTGLELAELGAMAQRVEKRFDAFSEEAGGAERTLAAFQRGAGNTVSDMDAMASASRLLQMGLVADADGMETVVEMASRLGDQTQSATDRVSDFALMLANQSIPRLDNFGISSGKVRARIAELQAETKGMTREAAFMQAVMEQGALSLGKLGPRVDDAASAFERNEAKMANLRVEMGQKLIPAAMVVTEAFSGLLDIAASMIDIVSGASIKIAGFTENLMSVAEAIPGVINPLLELSGTLETVTSLLDIQAAAQTADQMGTLSDATQVAEGYMGSWSVYAAEMIAEGASLGEVMVELARTQNDTSDAFESGGAVQAFFKDALVDQKGIMQETVAVTQAIALENALATGSYETYTTAIGEFNSIQTDANGAVVALTESQFNMAQIMRDGASEASLLADEIFTSRLENQGYTSAVEESTRAVGELSGEFQNSGPPMREWAATSAELARAVEETTIAEAEAEKAAIAAAAAMEEKRQKDVALAIEETNLAQSVMGASDAMIAQTFIQGLDPDAMGLVEYRDAVENIQLAFGLATPESIALSRGLTDGMEAANQGRLAIEDLDKFIIALREDAADGAVDFNALGAEFASAAGDSSFLIAGMDDTSTAVANAAEQAEGLTQAEVDLAAAATESTASIDHAAERTYAVGEAIGDAAAQAEDFTATELELAAAAEEAASGSEVFAGQVLETGDAVAEAAEQADKLTQAEEDLTERTYEVGDAIGAAAVQAGDLTQAEADLAAEASAVVDGFADVTNATSDAGVALDELGSSVTNAKDEAVLSLEEIESAMLATADVAGEAGTDIGENLADGLVPSVATATEDATTELGGLDDAMAEAADRATAAGAAIADHLADGLLPGVQDMVDEFTRMLQEGISDNLPTNPPPRNASSPLHGLPRQGAAIMNSIVAGMNSAAPNLAGAIAQAAEGMNQAFAGSVGTLGRTAGGIFRADIVDPLKGTTESITADLKEAGRALAKLDKEIQRTAEQRAAATTPEEQLELSTELVALERERAMLAERMALSTERRDAANKELQIQEARLARFEDAQTRLKFLEQQSDLLELMAETGLDVDSVLGGITLGVDASAGDVLDAMARATELLVEQAEVRLRFGKELTAEERKALELQSARERLAGEKSRLGFLKQQADLMALITKEGLDADAVLGDLELGLDASDVGLLDAMARATAMLTAQAEARLLLGEQLPEEEEVIASDVQQERLDFLQKQLDLLDSLESRGLNAFDVLNRNTLGLFVSAENFAFATSAAADATIEQAEIALVAALDLAAEADQSAEEIFASIGELERGGGEAGALLLERIIQPLKDTVVELTGGLADARQESHGLAVEQQKIYKTLSEQADFGQLWVQFSRDRSKLTKKQLALMLQWNANQERRGELTRQIRASEEGISTATERLIEQQERLMHLQEQQERLKFLERQMQLLDLIAEKGLDANAILGGMELGVDASVDDVIAAMSRAMEAIIAQANEELGIASPSRVFERIGAETMTGMALGIEDMMGLPVAQSLIATQAMVSAPAMVAGSSITRTDNSRTMGDVNVNNPLVPNQAAADQLTAQIRREITNYLRGVS